MMPLKLKLSADEAILEYLRSKVKEKLSSYQIAAGTQLSSDRLYPALARLEAARKIDSEWEWHDKKLEPRRRLYFLAGDS